MWSFLLVTQWLALPSAATEAAFPEITSEVQSGTLIFSQGDCLAVQVFSCSPYTHVGMVMIEQGHPVVYDAMNGPGVRKTPLADYLRFLVPSDVEVVQPSQAWDASHQAALLYHLESQLGRPYRIRHFSTGERCEGVHCAEYITDALIAAGKLKAQRPPRVSPGSLRQGVLESGVYRMGRHYAFTPAPVVEPSLNETWCDRCCRQTAECWTAMCQQLSRSVLCREK